MFTIASRSFRILGSGTSSTCTVLRPDQTVARMSDPHLLELGVVERLGRALLQLALEKLALGGGIRARDLAGLDELLEAPQVVLRLRERLCAGQLLRELAALPGGVDLDVDLGAAVAGGVLERDRRVARFRELRLALRPLALNLVARAVYCDRRLSRTHGAGLRGCGDCIQIPVPGPAPRKRAALRAADLEADALPRSTAGAAV